MGESSLAMARTRADKPRVGLSRCAEIRKKAESVMFANGKSEFLTAFELTSGKKIWRVKVDAMLKKPHGNSPRRLSCKVNFC